MDEHFKLRIRNAKQLVQICNNGEKYKAGASQNEIVIIENGTIVVDNEGIICAVGKESELANNFKNAYFDRDIDATGKVVLPGFVDGHTHPVWSGDRVHEFAMKLAGATYLEIHQKGGGIGFTVEQTKKSSDEELLQLLTIRLNRMLRAGTTTVECKSGYGLDLENEMRLLKIIHMAKSNVPIGIVTTYLGAHSIPKNKTLQEYTSEIVDTHIPQITKLKSEGKISVENIDVFLEKGVFGPEETKKILTAGKQIGLSINFHGDELNPMKAGELGAELNALAISHLEHVSDEGMKEMAKGPVFAVLLPSTAYILRLQPPPARKLIQYGVPVALGSDFNPNAHCLSMGTIMNFACVNMKMTMNEALVAATLNSAASLNLSRRCGSLEIGKFGDFVIIDAPAWEHVIYQLSDPPIEYVIRHGNIVYHPKETCWKAY